MNFFKRPHKFRRYQPQRLINGYASAEYTDFILPADVQTTSDQITTEEGGSRAIQRLKVFCDYEILVANPNTNQKADMLWFQDTWFECQSSRLSENTILRHWTTTFTECLYQGSPWGNEEMPEENPEETEDMEDDDY